MTIRLLDLFCGAGGAAVGYHRAGFEVVGCDIAPQPNYPFTAVRCSWDAIPIEEIRVRFDAVHASPPCQGYSTQTADPSKHSRLIDEVRERLIEVGLPYVIENVEGARKHMRNPIRMCGSSFGLDVRRHRYFESNVPIVGKPCDHAWQTPRFRSLDMSMVRAGRLASVVGVHGHINYSGEAELRRKAMGIDWMTDTELVESVPPAYTEHIGRQFVALLED